MTKQTAAIVDDQAEWFNRNMLKIVRKVRNRLTAELNKFDRSGGNLENTPANIQRLNQIYGSIMTELQNAGYGDLVQQLQAKEGELLKSIKSSRPAGTVPIAFTETSRDALAGFNSLFNQQFGGLAQSVARDIAGAVGNSIFGTQSIEATMGMVAKLLDDKFARYAATYVNTSRAQFIQAAEYESAKGYDGDLYWIYEGPEDDITRPICRVGTGMDADGAYPNAPYFTESERLSFEAESAGLRMYNCRHSFMQISEEYYNENVGTIEGKWTDTEYQNIKTDIENAKYGYEFNGILKRCDVKGSMVVVDGEQSILNARQSVSAVADLRYKYGKKAVDNIERIQINVDTDRPTWFGQHGNGRIIIKNLTNETISKENTYISSRIKNGRQPWTVNTKNGLLYDVMVHEIGHNIDWGNKLWQKYDDVIKDAWARQTPMNADRIGTSLAKNNLTEYGLSTKAEYMAESFAAWNAGQLERMDKAIINIFNDLFGVKQ